MIPITKERIIQAFKNKERKRNSLLYDYYRQEVFNKDYSAFIMAEMITQDLGFPITPHIIYNINKRIINPHKRTNPDSSQQVNQNSAGSNTTFINNSELNDQLNLLQSIRQLNSQQIESLSNQQFYQLIQSDQINSDDLQYINSILSDSDRKSQVAFKLKSLSKKSAGTNSDTQAPQPPLESAYTEKSKDVIPKNKYQNAEDENKKNPFSDLMKGL